MHLPTCRGDSYHHNLSGVEDWGVRIEGVFRLLHKLFPAEVLIELKSSFVLVCPYTSPYLLCFVNLVFIFTLSRRHLYKVLCQNPALIHAWLPNQACGLCLDKVWRRRKLRNDWNLLTQADTVWYSQIQHIIVIVSSWVIRSYLYKSYC